MGEVEEDAAVQAAEMNGCYGRRVGQVARTLQFSDVRWTDDTGVERCELALYSTYSHSF